MNYFSKKLTQVQKVLLFFVILLLIIRLAMPFALKWYINKSLNSIPGYYGYVTDVSISLWRGAYQIDGTKLLKINGNRHEPLFASDEIKISLDWHALFERRIVAKVILQNPELQFIKRSNKEESQTHIDESWQNKIKSLVPINLNYFSIKNGLVRYKDETSQPKLDLYFQDIQFLAENLSNTAKAQEHLPSKISLTALLLKSGKTQFDAKLNALSHPIEADIKATIRGLKLKELNDFAKVYGNFNFNEGYFDATFELAATKTKYEGYLKTLFKKVEILNWSKERKQGASIKHLLWEGIVEGIVNIFKNGKKDQFAARIPITGTREDLEIKKWETVKSILRNGFIQALSPELEKSIHFSQIYENKSSKHKEKK